MKELRLIDAAAAVKGELSGDGSFKGVYTDSRKPVKGGLFIALEGEKFDGHDFVAEALQKGAAAAIVSKDVPQVNQTDKLFDGTAPDCVDQLAASIFSELTPAWTKWFNLSISAELNENQTDISKDLNEISEKACGLQ